MNRITTYYKLRSLLQSINVDQSENVDGVRTMGVFCYTYDIKL